MSLTKASIRRDPHCLVKSSEKWNSEDRDSALAVARLFDGRRRHCPARLPVRCRRGSQSVLKGQFGVPQPRRLRVDLAHRTGCCRRACPIATETLCQPRNTCAPSTRIPRESQPRLDPPAAARPGTDFHHPRYSRRFPAPSTWMARLPRWAVVYCERLALRPQLDLDPKSSRQGCVQRICHRTGTLLLELQDQLKGIRDIERILSQARIVCATPATWVS